MTLKIEYIIKQIEHNVLQIHAVSVGLSVAK